MAEVTTGSWGQQKYLTHFCLTFLLATEFTDTPENTNRQNFAATYADTIFIFKKRKEKTFHRKLPTRSRCMGSIWFSALNGRILGSCQTWSTFQIGTSQNRTRIDSPGGLTLAVFFSIEIHSNGLRTEDSFGAREHLKIGASWSILSFQFQYEGIALESCWGFQKFLIQPAENKTTITI